MPDDLKKAGRNDPWWKSAPPPPPLASIEAAIAGLRSRSVTARSRSLTSPTVLRPISAIIRLVRDPKLLLPSRRAVFIAAWLIVASGLALIAFGFPNLPHAGSLLASLAHAGDVVRVIAFTGLGLLILFGLIWFWREIRNRHTLQDIGIFLVCAGIAGFLLLLGGYVLKVDLGQRATVILWLCSPALLFGGRHIIRENPTPRSRPSPGPSGGRTYHRKQVAIHGNARSADDWEIDQALRDKSGGFDPMFKD